MLLILFVGVENVLAQCAGADATITVCDKDTDAANRSFALFTQLTGTPTTGGTWATSNPANFAALNRTTGVVDLWRINNFGVHLFTYTNSACSQSATITLNLGGYAGEDNIDGSANACSDNSAVNLDGFLGSEIPGKVQDFNGLWEEDPSTRTNRLEDNIFNAEAAGPGTYIFTYTVDAVDSCLGEIATLVLEVHPSPIPGTPIAFERCTNDDFSGLTNVDLNTLLVGEGPNGTWAEAGTNELSDLNDSFINIDAINANFGVGSYEFTYTVFPTHPVCEEQTSTVTIVILPALIGALEAENYCLGEDYSVTLTYDSDLLPNGVYNLEYAVSESGNQLTGIATEVALVDGFATFSINPTLVTINRPTTITVINASGPPGSDGICSGVTVQEANFLVSDAGASAAEICTGTQASIVLSSILDTAGGFANGSYTVTYTTTSPTGTIASETLADIALTNGAGTFEILSETTGEPGTYAVVISIADTFPISCSLEASFDTLPPPDDINLGLLVDTNCNATQIDVLVAAPALSSGSYTITYDVTELGSDTVLTTNTINFTGGSAAYQIDVAALPEGNYTASVRSAQDDTTPCRTIFEFETTSNFARGGTPDSPQATADQTFCLNDYPNAQPTLLDIAVTGTGDLFFYATATDTNVLPINTALVDGEDYYISNTDTINNCEGLSRTQVTVGLTTPTTPTITATDPQFCETSNPTLADISVSLSAGNTLAWFSATGAPLALTTQLVNGQSYTATATLTGCANEASAIVTPVITTVATPTLLENTLVLCGLDNPTVAALRSLETDSENLAVWYTEATGGNALDDETLLQENTVYYADTVDATTSCTALARVAVTITLSDCEPENYDYFIPDGFSPNNDGRNDTYYIPNISTIYPDFTLEIVNRYGTTMFTGNKANAAWDGTHGSQIAPNGVYFYIINYNKDDATPVQGRLYLNR